MSFAGVLSLSQSKIVTLVVALGVVLVGGGTTMVAASFLSFNTPEAVVHNLATTTIGQHDDATAIRRKKWSRLSCPVMMIFQMFFCISNFL